MNAKKTKKKSFGIQLISILVVVAIISVGFAAWIITSPISGESVQGGFIAQDYVDNTFSITIDIQEDKVLTFGKPASGDQSAAAKFYNGDDAYKFNWFSYEGTDPDEVMEVSFTVTIDPTEDGVEKIEDLLLDRSVMISLTLNNGLNQYVAADDGVEAHYVEVKATGDDENPSYAEDLKSDFAYSLYKAASDGKYISEPKMTCTSGTENSVSNYTEVLFFNNSDYKYTGSFTGPEDPENDNKPTASTAWSDNNAISIILDKEAFVKENEGYNFVATVTLSVDWGTYFDIWYNAQNTIVEAETADATHIENVNPYYFFNLQNIYKEGNRIAEAKSAIKTIFALNYTAAKDANAGKVSGSGVQYELSIHPIPYVDVNK